jgi:hypothetical protein
MDEVAAAAAAQPAQPLSHVTFPLPEAGEVGGMLNIGTVFRGGDAWVRLVWGTPGALTVIDIPCKAGDGSNPAQGIGQQIVDAARVGRTGLVVP